MEAMKKYEKNGVTVVWKPRLCVHSAICLKSLPKVFSLRFTPWIDLDGANMDEVIETVHKCPTGAISIEGETPQTTAKDSSNIIKVSKGGPLVISGDFKVTNSEGEEIETGDTTYLCRCGKSKNKPFCDGSHVNLDCMD